MKPSPVAVAVLLLSACPPAPVIVKAQQDLMGTAWEMTVATHADREVKARVAIGTAFDEVARIEALMSEFRSGSDIDRINAGAGGEPVLVSSEVARIVQRSLDLCARTDGLLDVTFLPLGRLWDLHRQPFVVPDDDAVAAARSLVDCHAVDVDPATSTVRLRRAGMALGLGAVAKQYAVGRAVDVLAQAGFGDVLVSGGGDVEAAGTRGDTPWIVGIQDPRGERGTLLGRLRVRDRALVTSGDYERFVEIDGKRVHHVLDPRTGSPSEGTWSASVLTSDATRAMGIATALLIGGRAEASVVVAREPDVDALLVEPGGACWMTRGFAENVEWAAAAATRCRERTVASPDGVVREGVGAP